MTPRTTANGRARGRDSKTKDVDVLFGCPRMVVFVGVDGVPFGVRSHDGVRVGLSMGLRRSRARARRRDASARGRRERPMDARTSVKRRGRTKGKRDYVFIVDVARARRRRVDVCEKHAPWARKYVEKSARPHRTPSRRALSSASSTSMESMSNIRSYTSSVAMIQDVSASSRSISVRRRVVVAAASFAAAAAFVVAFVVVVVVVVVVAFAFALSFDLASIAYRPINRSLSGGTSDSDDSPPARSSSSRSAGDAKSTTSTSLFPLALARASTRSRPPNVFGISTTRPSASLSRETVRRSSSSVLAFAFILAFARASDARTRGETSKLCVTRAYHVNPLRSSNASSAHAREEAPNA